MLPKQLLLKNCEERDLSAFTVSEWTEPSRSLNRINRDSPSIVDNWVVPGIMARNETFGYVDSAGDIGRRIVLFMFKRKIKKIFEAKNLSIFGMDTVSDKFMFIAPEFKLDQSEFQSMVTGESRSLHGVTF